MYGLTSKGSVDFFLIGFLETKRMMGFKKSVQGCVSHSDTGFYLTYPNDLIDFVLAMAAEDVPHAGTRSVSPSGRVEPLTFR